MASLNEKLRELPRNYIGVVGAAKLLASYFPIHEVHGAPIDPTFYEMARKETGQNIKHCPSDDLIGVKGLAVKDEDGKGFGVLISNNQSYCWKRFTLCKELCQVLTDGMWSASGGPVQQLGIASKRPSYVEALTSESFCYYLAIEVMIPEGFRDFAVANRGRLSDFDLADQIKVPEWIITEFFDKIYASSCSARAALALSEKIAAMDKK